MKSIKKGSLAILFAAISAFLMAVPALAANDITVTTEGDAAGAALGIGMIICYLPALVVGLVIYIWVAVWIYRDAVKRGAPPALWLVLWVFFNWVGLIIYLVMRPKEFVASAPAATPPPPPPVDSGQDNQ